MAPLCCGYFVSCEKLSHPETNFTFETFSGQNILKETGGWKKKQVPIFAGVIELSVWLLSCEGVLRAKLYAEPSVKTVLLHAPCNSRFSGCRHLTTISRLPLIFFCYLNFEFPVGFKVVLWSKNHFPFFFRFWKLCSLNTQQAKFWALLTDTTSKGWI